MKELRIHVGIENRFCLLRIRYCENPPERREPDCVVNFEDKETSGQKNTVIILSFFKLSGGLTIPEALAKELGLKLETKKRPMDVLVIDHAERMPTAN